MKVETDMGKRLSRTTQWKDDYWIGICKEVIIWIKKNSIEIYS